MSYKKNLKILEGIWRKNRGEAMTCPQCQGSLMMVQIEQIYDTENPYIPYKTVIECNSCSFKLITESFTILGSIKNFDLHNVEIGSWSPSGSRVISRYEHILNYDLLRELEKTGELVEFLVVNNQVVQVIG